MIDYPQLPEEMIKDKTPEEIEEMKRIIREHMFKEIFHHETK